MTRLVDLEPVHWDEAEPSRLAQDTADLLLAAPGLAYAPARREWEGRLPLWPFPRPRPAGLLALLPEGMLVRIATSPAHPLEEPAVYPLDVDIEVRHRLDHHWHVAGDGRLCLTQGPLAWEPEDSISELVLKAAAWRCELILLQAGVIREMSEKGIVSDTSRDHMFAQAALTEDWTLR